MRFHIADPKPRKKLVDILPRSLRAQSWLARANAIGSIPSNRIVQVAGGVTILSGLDYHHDQFTIRFNRLEAYFDLQVAGLPGQNAGIPWRPATSTERRNLDALDHEALAYLNRLGQFWYFAKAMHRKHMVPRITELLSFRHKHGAHRSIDMPQGESVSTLEGHAMAFGFYRLAINQYPVYQLYDKGKHINFHVRDDHVIVMNEAIRVFRALYAPPIDV